MDLGPADVFTAGGAAVFIDNDMNADLQDAELDELNNWSMAILTIARQGAPVADDVFGFVDNNGLMLVGTNIEKNGQVIATFMNTAGALGVTFTDANGQTPTSIDVDNVLRNITYDNTNAAPPAMVTLEATIDDVGVGGGIPMQGMATVPVTIVP